MTPSARTARILALPLLMLLALPALALVTSSTPGDVLTAMQDPAFLPALGVSLRTSLSALVIVVVGGTPIAWWLARHQGPTSRVIGWVVDVPIVLPPAVVGLSLLIAFGPHSVIGRLLHPIAGPLPFTAAAVVLAQTVVAAPFYIHAAADAFRSVDEEFIAVARTLGLSPFGALRRVAFPLAAPGLLGGAALAWARALGEFGATLLFAGNRDGVTQTMPVAIYVTLERDLRAAVALALALATLSLLALVLLRWGGGRGLRGMRP